MAWLPVQQDKVIPLADIFHDRLLLIERYPELVKIGGLKMGAVADAPGLRGNGL